MLRGTKTLPLRMAQHNANGLALAQFLERHPKVRRVYYPGLESHPQHDARRAPDARLRRDARFELGSLEAARRFAAGTRLFALAESLGGVESLIEVPARMTMPPRPMRRSPHRRT